MALYRKYRSKTFDELIGQDHIRTSLLRALEAGRISHAYLFSGPRGVGKTSTARLLARFVNELPAGDNISSHLDVIEIDAASNRRIDEIRDLREKVHIAPAQAKYKVYIVDEVHMLTTEAFNALLKTLEEPPSHAIFVLATTEPQKLPDTIISRTQRFNFRPVPEQKIADHLRTIATAEKLKIDDEALRMIAAAGGGSVRDSISILDQAASLATGKQDIGAKQVASLLGQTDRRIIDKLLKAIASSDGGTLLETLDQLWAQGAEPIQVVEQLTAHYRQALREAVSSQPPATDTDFIARLVNGLAQLPMNSNYLNVALETLLLTAALAAPNKQTSTTTVPSSQPLPASSKPAQPKAEERSDEVLSGSEGSKEKAEERGHEIASSDEGPTEKTEATAPKKDTPKPKDKARGPKNFDDKWAKVLARVREQNNSLYALLRAAEPKLRDNQLTLYFRFQFHKGRLEEARNIKIVRDAMEQVIDDNVQIQAKLSRRDQQSKAEAKDDASTILQVFGGEIVP